MAAVLPRAFYRRDTLRVARELLGKVLIVSAPDGAVAGRIVETEAYIGDDPASHSAKGETPRASIMFGEPGVAYVYFVYGMYEMLNFVTEPKGRAGAVLIRALEPLAEDPQGAVLMRSRRETLATKKTKAKKAPIKTALLAAGPGKLCRALGIELSHNGSSLGGPAIVVVDDGQKPDAISVSPRVGITAAKDKPWRFFVTGNASVSRAPQNALAKPWRALSANSKKAARP